MYLCENITKLEIDNKNDTYRNDLLEYKIKFNGVRIDRSLNGTLCRAQI